MALATLSIDLIAKVAGFEQELKRVADSTTRQANAMAGAIGVVKASVAGLAGYFSASMLTGFVRATVDGIDALNDLKDATGASIENISALEDVAARTGTSLDTVGTSLIKLNDNLREVKPGDATSEALKAIGLSAEELKRLDPAEALRRVAVALNGFADDGNKARLVQELFGKSLREVAPFLKDLGEKGQLNAKVTTAQAEAAERLNNQLAELRKNSQDTARAIVSDLVPAMNRMLGNYIQLKEQGLLGTLLSDAAKDMVGLGQLTDNAGADINRLIALRDELQAKGREGGMTDSIKAEIDQVNKLLAISRIRQAGQLDFSTQYSDAVSRRFGQRPTVGFKGTSEKPQAEQIEDARRALAGYVNTLQNNLDTAQQLTEVEKALDFLRSQGVQGEIPQVRELVLAIAEQIDAEKELARVRSERKEADRQMAAEASRIWEATRTPEEKLNIQMAKLDEMLEKGAIDWDTYSRAVIQASEATDKTTESAKEGKTIAEELGLTFSSAAEDALVNWRDLGEVIRGVGKDMARIIYRKSITEPLGTATSDAIKNVNWKEMFGFADGGIMTANGPLPLRAYAGGGVASSPQIALYGEGSMNEAFVPLPDGRRIPVAMQGGGGGNLHITNHIDARADQASMMAALHRFGEQLKADILRNRAHGGVFV